MLKWVEFVCLLQGRSVISIEYDALAQEALISTWREIPLQGIAAGKTSCLQWQSCLKAGSPAASKQVRGTEETRLTAATHPGCS